MHDLVDHIECIAHRDRRATLTAQLKKVMDGIDRTVLRGVLRDLMIDQISVLIDKFPIDVQKELLAMLTTKYMREWQQ